MSENTKIGLSLGGGGARGIGHVVVLEALDELGIKIDEITGSSIGSLIGMGYATGMSGRDLRRYVLSTFDDRAKVLSNLWDLRPSSLQDWFKPESYSLGQFNPEKILSTFTPVDEFPENIEDLETTLSIVATDYYAGNDVVYRKGNLRQAVGASIAIPMIFKPVEIDGRILIDGNIANPLPFDQFVEPMDRVIAVDVVGGPDPAGSEIPSGFKSMLGANQIMMQAITQEKLARLTPPDVLIRPPINSFGVMDFLKSSTILRMCDQKKEEIKQQIDTALSKA